jgi:hypothetical protein
MFITAEELIQYLGEYCEDVECPYLRQNGCPMSCPVQQAVQAAAQMLDDPPFDTERVRYDHT